MSNVGQLIRDANPIQGEPSLLADDELDALLLLAQSRSGNVDVQEMTKPVEPKKNQRTGWLIAAAVAAVTIVVIGAVALLSPSASPQDVTDTPTTTLGASPTSTTSGIAQTGPVIVEVEAYDYGFQGLPLELAAGNAIELVNTSPTEYHNLVAIRLDDADARSIEDFAVLPPEAFGAETPQPGFSIVGALHAAPGEEACEGRVRLQVPGRYLIIDMVPEGADAAVVEGAVPCSGSDGGGAPYKVPGGPLGYEHGMITIVTVTAK